MKIFINILAFKFNYMRVILLTFYFLRLVELINQLPDPIESGEGGLNYMFSSMQKYFLLRMIEKISKKKVNCAKMVPVSLIDFP